MIHHKTLKKKLKKLIVGEVAVIPDLPSYAKYWRNKFTRLFEESQLEDEGDGERADDILSKVLAQYTTCLQTDVGKSDITSQYLEVKKDKSQQNFYFLSDVLQEDKDLRAELQMKKLQHVIDIQEKERNEFSKFNRCCLFCRTTFQSVPHSNLFDHMAFEHNFSVGKPDNLVYANELLDLLEDKLERMVCIYCEKTFKSREVLKEHMRKKNHKKINPRNHTYDKFYIVNYLELGKTWQTYKENSCADEELPTGFDDNDDDDDCGSGEEGRTNEDTDEESNVSEVGDAEDEGHDWSDWRKFLPGFVCLFCPAYYPNCGRGASDLFVHMTAIHDFDFVQLKNERKLTFYQQVKAVNYIRRQMHLSACVFCDEKIITDKNEKNIDSYKEGLLLHMQQQNHIKLPDDQSEWDQSQYLFPTYENDILLSYLPDEDEGICKSSESNENTQLSNDTTQHASSLSHDCSKAIQDKEVNVIAETFALESESSIRESILFRPEMRAILTPRYPQQKDENIEAGSRIRSKVNRNRGKPSKT